MDVASLTLVKSGVCIEWQPARLWWRALSPRHAAGLERHHLIDWWSWTGLPDSPVAAFSMTNERREPGEWGWHVLVGERDADGGRPPLLLDDIRDPVEATLGSLWAWEWIGPLSVVHVAYDGLDRRLDLRRRAHYLSPEELDRTSNIRIFGGSEHRQLGSGSTGLST
jgi:hypothetical protein